MHRYNDPTLCLKREREDYPGLSIEYGRMARAQFLKLAWASVASRKYENEERDCDLERAVGTRHCLLGGTWEHRRPHTRSGSHKVGRAVGLAVKGSHKQGQPGLSQDTLVFAAQCEPEAEPG